MCVLRGLSQGLFGLVSSLLEVLGLFGLVGAE
jgi:hypothetical protein